MTTIRFGLVFPVLMCSTAALANCPDVECPQTGPSPGAGNIMPAPDQKFTTGTAIKTKDLERAKKIRQTLEKVK